MRERSRVAGLGDCHPPDRLPLTTCYMLLTKGPVHTQVCRAQAMREDRSFVETCRRSWTAPNAIVIGKLAKGMADRQNATTDPLPVSWLRLARTTQFAMSSGTV